MKQWLIPVASSCVFLGGVWPSRSVTKQTQQTYIQVHSPMSHWVLWILGSPLAVRARTRGTADVAQLFWLTCTHNTQWGCAPPFRTPRTVAIGRSKGWVVYPPSCYVNSAPPCRAGVRPDCLHIMHVAYDGIACRRGPVSSRIQLCAMRNVI